MRVLLITGHDHWGSLDANSPIARIVIGLGEAGHDVMYVSNDKVCDPVNEIYGQPIDFLHQQVCIVRFRLPGDASIWPFVRGLPVARSIYQRFREVMFILIAVGVSLYQARGFHPDIVYGYEILGIIAAKVVALLLQKPLVSRFQGTILYPLLLEARRGLLSRLNLLRYWVHLLALKCPAQLIVMTNDGTRGNWVVQTLGNRSPMVFWFNGTDFWGLIREGPTGTGEKGILKRLGIPEDSQVIVSVSRLVRWKRVDRIVRALPYVLERVPNVRYVAVGDGPERDALQALAFGLGVEEAVTFVGNLPHSAVREVMSHSDVFVSMYDLSNLGNPLIEALCLGKPVVTYDVGDTRDVIENDVNGILLASDEPIVVADAIKRVLCDPHLARTLGKNAAEYTHRRFWSWDRRIRAEVEMLERLAKGERLDV